MLKYGGRQLQARICHLIELIWTQNKIPEDWYIGIITPIHKKGDKQKCVNYRPITLLNVVYKILANLVNKRLKEYAEGILGDYQNGFRPGRSTISAIHTLEQIFQKRWEHGEETHTIFIDFKSAFDTLNRKEMFKELEILKVPQKLRTILEVSLKHTKAKVRFQGTTTHSFEINKGVKQGDPISPTLFNLVLEGVLRRTKLDKKNIMTDQIQLIAYADDVAITASTRDGLIRAIENLDAEAQKFGMTINEAKTKYLKLGKGEAKSQNFLKTKKYNFEAVSSFNYLGVTVGGTARDKVRERILKGNQAYGRNKLLLKNKMLSKKTKIKIYKTLIRPVITYALETMVINRKEEEDLKIMERRIMRTILGPNITEDGEVRMKRNREIEQELGGENIVRCFKANRLQWAGHIMRRKPTEMIRRVTQWIPLGTRSRGRPRKRWGDAVEEDARTIGVTDWKSKCRDRAEWRKTTRVARTHNGL